MGGKTGKARGLPRRQPCRQALWARGRGWESSSAGQACLLPVLPDLLHPFRFRSAASAFLPHSPHSPQPALLSLSEWQGVWLLRESFPGWDGGDRACLCSPEDALSEFRVRHQNEHSLGLHRRAVGLLPRLLQPLTSLSPLLHPCLPQSVEGRQSGFRKGLEGEGRPGGEGIRGGEKERTWRERYVCVENVKIRLHVSMCFVLSFKHYFLKLGIRQGR